ncbi:MAG: recombination protein O N-terminal domain-containing protein, partial [Eubacteriales bacterium]|nr:recombination protein O N-terminal domain-containing protein [Eubacteriales bacterium]
MEAFGRMQGQDVTAKGIILSAAPQGEYGRRLSILTDRYGKICVFAQAAAKPKSHLLGVTLPMTCAEFTLARGKGAWNLHGVRLIESFSPLFADPVLSCYALYFLEVLSWFSQEGMEEAEAKQLLNLTFVALKALSREGEREKKETEKQQEAEMKQADGTLRLLLIRRMYELRMLVI